MGCRSPRWLSGCLLALLAALPFATGPVASAVAADAPPRYAEDIQPIFKQRCYSCHGPDKQESGLRLDRKVDALAGGDSGKVIVPGDADGSVLIKLVAGKDPDRIMPPDGDQLDDDEIKTLKNWIAAGAPWPDDPKKSLDASEHWSFQPIRRPVPPSVPGAQSPVDAFIGERLAASGTTFSPEADRLTLLRRLSFDLLGLPPTPEEVDRFVADPDPDAYVTLVDELLASPRFGERWGRHWLDLARYADSDGYEKDNPRYHAWKYRDWVIEAINRDQPFDEFTIEQLAGDLLPGATAEQRIATGFNRQTLTNTEGGVDQEQFRVEAVFDRTETLGAVWLGLTVGCARCHSHKYDPLPLRDYFGLFAFFNASDEANLTTPTSADAVQDFERRQRAWRTEQTALQAVVDAAAAPLQAAFPDWFETQRAALLRLTDAPPEFLPLTIRSAAAERGSTLASLDDGVWLASGERPQQEVYVIEAELPPGTTALKLEALSHPSLPANGPGRADHGNFVLSEVTVAASEPLQFASAKASFAQSGFPSELAIDGVEDSRGWAVAPKFGETHHALFRFDPSAVDRLALAPLRATIRLSQQYDTPGYPPHLLGAFRLSAMTGDDGSSLGLPEPVLATLRKPLEHLTDAERFRAFEHFSAGDEAVGAARQRLAEHDKAKPTPPEMPAAVIRAARRDTRILRRGDFLQPGDAIEPATPGVLPPMVPRGDSNRADRLDLARWLVAPDNPLTARVAVNHMWRHLFGRGLVPTMNDFGTRGDPPTHPELLDWLAAEFQSRGWSRKTLIRQIVLSRTYRQSSTERPELRDLDPQNSLYARQNRFRVEAEAVRDAALAASGLLQDRLGGPSVFPPLPPGIAALSYADNFTWGASEWNTRPDRPWGIAPQDDIHRRGLYTFFKRTAPHPNLTTFDCPDANLACVERQVSNTPLQALITLNNATFLEAARGLASRIRDEPLADEPARLRRLFRLAVGRPPASDDLLDLGAYLAAARGHYAQNPDAARAFAGAGADIDAEAAAWTATARVVLNLDEFLTRE
ncbi:MAG: PSD1 domain-containing protein [Planctomyces sp.]|nr:PSD1 domain-containing protein [Planctomyces sp.]